MTCEGIVLSVGWVSDTSPSLMPANVKTKILRKSPFPAPFHNLLKKKKKPNKPSLFSLMWVLNKQTCVQIGPPSNHRTAQRNRLRLTCSPRSEAKATPPVADAALFTLLAGGIGSNR